MRVPLCVTVFSAALKAEGLVEKWEKTSWAKKLAVRAKRANLSDFDRFNVMVTRKRKAYAVRKLAAAKKKK